MPSSGLAPRLSPIFINFAILPPSCPANMPGIKKQKITIHPVEMPESSIRPQRNYWFEFTLVFYIGFLGMAFTLALAMTESYFS